MIRLETAALAAPVVSSLLERSEYEQRQHDLARQRDNNPHDLPEVSSSAEFYVKVARRIMDGYLVTADTEGGAS